jgi:hypothetical protein
MRLAILAGGPGVEKLLPVYLESIHRLPRDPELAPVMARLLPFVPYNDLLRQVQRSYTSPEASAELDALWDRNRRALLRLVHERPEVADDFRTLLVYQHSDWVLPLGNALDRMIRRNRRGVIGDRLETHGFVRPMVPRIRAEEVKGHLTAAWAVEAGMLLELARTLRVFSQEVPEALSEASGVAGEEYRLVYPQTVSELADALLQWHEALLELTGARPDAR